jgi:type II secretory pathway pseudopilin PulG
MVSYANLISVEAAVAAANLQPSQATRPFGYRFGQAVPLRSLRFRDEGGFTLVELLVSVGVLALLVLLVTSLVNSAATITSLGNKRMGADSQARQVLDRMAIDFAQMVKRADVDYYLKAPANLQTGNDQIAFYSAVPGYYPATGSQSPMSIVAYRINSLTGTAAFNKLERLGKGLVWNGVSSGTPAVFAPVPIASPSALIPTSGTPTPAWPQAGNSNADPDYELIGPQVIRFEYYYLLNSGNFSGIPWDTSAGHTRVTGMQDVAAIVADIAVIDSTSKVLLSNAQITTLAAGLTDYTAGMLPGQLRANWQTYLDGITGMPRPAISGVRLYEQYFYLSPPTLLTP